MRPAFAARVNANALNAETPGPLLPFTERGLSAL